MTKGEERLVNDLGVFCEVYRAIDIERKSPAEDRAHKLKAIAHVQTKLGALKKTVESL